MDPGRRCGGLPCQVQVVWLFGANENMAISTIAQQYTKLVLYMFNGPLCLTRFIVEFRILYVNVYAY